VLAARTTANAMRMEHMRVKGDPERAQKAVDSVRRAIDALNEELARTRTAIATREAEIADQRTAITSVSASKRDLDAKIAKYNADIAARAAEVRDVEDRLRSQRLQHKELLESRLAMQNSEAAAQVGGAPHDAASERVSQLQQTGDAA